LDIGFTCILRGNYHHLMNEVWPHTFRTHLYQKIRGHLDRMLLGSKSRWELSYTSAKQHLLHDAEKFSALEQIYNEPSHFAGWFLKKIEGNLLLHGSVPVEQNHSSVAASREAVTLAVTYHCQATMTQGQPGLCCNRELQVPATRSGCLQ
jgi:hypothetical protein